MLTRHDSFSRMINISCFSFQSTQTAYRCKEERQELNSTSIVSLTTYDLRIGIQRIHISFRLLDSDLQANKPRECMGPAVRSFQRQTTTPWDFFSTPKHAFYSYAFFKIWFATLRKQKNPVRFQRTGPDLHRRDEKIRTSDLQHPMLARYRATLHPEEATNILIVLPM